MYTNNFHMPRLRRDVVLFAQRYGVRKAARHFGFSPGAVSLWKKKMMVRGYGPIPTQSSRPLHHPRALSSRLVQEIIATRLRLKRSSEVVHEDLRRRGVTVSLSSVKRTLDRQYLIRKRSPWKRYHAPTERPATVAPGTLIQADTIHLAINGKTVLYVFTLIDVYSRWVYARAYARANARVALAFVKRAQTVAPFLFDCIQTDNGPEWSTYFTERLRIRHRHSRVRQSNDNAHVERLNRTIQEECIDGLPVDLTVINRALPRYLTHYNEKRLHFGLKLQTPLEFIHKCSQAID